MSQAICTLKKGEGRTIKAGGMWIYDNEIDSILGSFENGDVVAVRDFDGYFLGYGFINTKSKITIRLLSRKKDAIIDEAFMEQRVRDAWEYHFSMFVPVWSVLCDYNELPACSSKC